VTGLLLLVAAALWVAVGILVTRFVTKKLPDRPLRFLARLVLFAILSVLPLSDEIVGKHQFKELCEKYSHQFVDEKNILRRNVVFVPRGQDQYADRTAVRIRIDPHVYRDSETGRVLVSYHTLHAGGGWLIRILGFSESNNPLLFNPSCGPSNEDGFKKKFEVTVLN